MNIEQLIRESLDRKIADKAAQAQTEREQRLQHEQAKIDLHSERLAILTPFRALVVSTLRGFSEMPEFYTKFGPEPITELADTDGNMSTNFSSIFSAGSLGQILIMSAGQKLAYGVNLSIVDNFARYGNENRSVVAKLEFLEIDEGSDNWVRIPEETVFLDTSSAERIQKTLIEGMSGFLVQHIPSQSTGYGT